MKLDDSFDYEFDYENHPGKLNPWIAVLVVSVFILGIILVVVMVNRKPVSHQPVEEAAAEQTGEEVDAYGYPATSSLVEEDGLTPDDLDFWDMYPKEEETASDTPGKDVKKAEDKKNTEGEEKSELIEEEKDPLDDGRHTLIEYADGTKEWVVISPYLSRNTYDFSKLESDKNQLKYIENGKKASYLGVDLSKYQGDVDFSQLKQDGIDYVMLKVGGRGYSSGQITADDYFSVNLQSATDAGLGIGVYFFSQAVTAEEAVEEANYVINSLAGYNIQYPVAFDMEYVENDTARVEALTRADKTAVARAFLTTVQNAGYRPMIYGNKEWLLKKIDLTQLTEFDVWLSQEKDVPDYPYKFAMWQYTTSAKLSGISGYADLNLCFIDYSAK